MVLSSLLGEADDHRIDLLMPGEVKNQRRYVRTAGESEFEVARTRGDSYNRGVFTFAYESGETMKHGLAWLPHMVPFQKILKQYT